MPSSGQLLKHEEREPISPAIPEEASTKLIIRIREQTLFVFFQMVFRKGSSRRLANISAKLFNELNYERRQQFFHEKKVDFNITWDKYYEKYKEELKVNAQAVMQKSNEAWNSFFSLLKLKKEEKLPTFMKHVSLPRYWNDRETKKRKLLLVVRQDRYVVDEQNTS
jgi:transposase